MRISTRIRPSNLWWRTALALSVLTALAACSGGDDGSPAAEPALADGAQRLHTDTAGGELKFFDNALVVTLPANAVTGTSYVDVQRLPDAGLDTCCRRPKFDPPRAVVPIQI